MVPGTISGSRLTELLKRWKSIAETGDKTASQCKGLFFVFGELSPNTLGNQRGQAVTQYLLDTASPPTNVAVLMTETASVIVVADKATVALPAVPVEGTGCGAAHSITVVVPSEAATALSPLIGDGLVGAAMRELEIQEGAFAAEVIACLRSVASGQGQLVEAAPLLGELLFTKDGAALSCVEKAARLCSALFRRYARQAMEEQLQSSAPKTLFQMREELCEKLERPNTVHGLEGVNAAEFSMAAGLTPCVFHRGTYIPQIQVDPAQLEAATATVPLRGDVVTIRFGAKNNGYTAFLARTLIVKPKAPSGAQEAYEFLYDVSEKVISLLIPGAKLHDVHASAMAFATERNATLAGHLPKSLGFSTGLLVLESRGNISEKGTATVAAGMSFVVRVFLEDMPDGEGGVYAMELGDTVIVRDGVAELQTKVTRKASDIIFEDVEDDDAAAADGEVEGGAFEPQRRDLAKITRQGQSGTVILSREAQRDEELKKLLRKLHTEFLASGRTRGVQVPSEEMRVLEIGRLAFGEVSPFTGTDRLPPAEALRTSVYVQADRRVVWLSICGNTTPFHICTISKVDCKTEGDRHVLSIVFHALQEANVSYKLNRDKVFVKELHYTAATDNAFTDARDHIQAIQQRIKSDDANRKRNATTATTGKLVVGRIVTLPDVKLRPPVSVGRQNKGCVGNLELHPNGLRFSYLGGPPVDLLFDNIKHIIFQPAVQEISVIYHVTLKKAIEVNRKAVTEVQFVADVMESSELASGTRRSHEEEVNAELRDENRARQTNKQFFTFAEVVEKTSRIKTQLPTKNFFFDGVHTRSMVKFRGSKEVLWAVSDWPAFSMSVEEVEVVSLERVIPGGSTFDASFVMKDYNKPVVTLNSIPKQFLEVLKDWCLAAGLYYIETTVNPNWKVTLKDIRDDPEWDPWLPGAGWSVLNNDGDDDEEEEDSDSQSDSTYSEEEDEEDTDTDDSSWLEDEESDVETEADDSDASSAVSWDELDRRAQEQDRKRSYSDDDDDRPRKKARGAPAASPPANTSRRPGGGAPPTISRLAPGAGMSFGKTAVPPPRRF